MCHIHVQNCFIMSEPGDIGKGRCPTQVPTKKGYVEPENVIRKPRKGTGKRKLTLCQYPFRTLLGHFTISYSTRSLPMLNDNFRMAFCYGPNCDLHSQKEKLKLCRFT